MTKAEDLKAEALQLQKRLDEVLDEMHEVEHAGKHNCATCGMVDNDRGSGRCTIDLWADMAHYGDGRLMKSAKDCPGWREGS
jgi:hypothetical protein